MNTYLFAWLLSGVAALRLLVLLYHATASPLRRVPGPLLARFTDAWYFWRLYLGHFNEDNRHLHSKYGPVVRYGPNRYSINDPHSAKQIYAHGTSFAKSDWYAAFTSPGQWSLFSDQDVRRHARNRRLYQATYSMSALITYEPYVDACAALFTQRLGELAEASVRTNMGHWLQCYAFDVIGMITFSKRFGFLDAGEDVEGVIAALEEHLKYSSLTGIYSGLHRFLFPLKNYLAGKKGAARGYVLRFARDRMAEHQHEPKAMPTEEKNDGEGAVDFLTKFVGKHAKDPEEFTTAHTLAGCSSNIVAGSDTSAISLSAILYYLLRHPACFEKLRVEVDEHEREHEREHEKENGKGYITFKDSQGMTYLQAVIKEALRMHPASGLPLERVVPTGGATISGYFFPEGTIVGINSWVEHRNPAIFGPDADEFRPERWLVDDAEKVSYMNRHWMPFGLGSRTCIGRHISLLEISKLIPLLVRDFDFELAGALLSQEWSTASYWFVKPTDFTVRVSRRGGE